VVINTANGNTDVDTAQLLGHNNYSSLEDDPIIEDLLEKYETQIGNVHGTLGYNAYDRNRSYLLQLAADRYYDAAIKAWGDEYQIALAGGFFSLRSPGYLPQGNVTYAQLQSILPFDNELTLCSISGRDLQRKFFQTSNDNYFISYGDYGAQLRNNIDYNATYYIVTDTYTAYYAPNNLTVVEMFGQAVFARDLLADYIAAGGLN
jgi:2',3'-cyclic-nucleotide 2'-phosphodiesterase (5'-nucleotidase family)